MSDIKKKVLFIFFVTVDTLRLIFLEDFLVENTQKFIRKNSLKVSTVTKK